MKKFYFPCYALLLVIYFNISCQKEAKFQRPDVDVPETVAATIKGRIVDEANAPVTGALVKTASGTATTNLNGEFSLQDIQIDKSTGFIKAEKAGYFTGSRTIVVNEDGENYIEIELIPKENIGSFAATTGGAISIPGGGSIGFQPAGIVNSTTNTAYSGTVSVAAFHLNPSADNFESIMPGALRGINTANEEVGLQSFGMMAVELTGANGEKLQLAPNKAATINFPIPAELMSAAPQTIPLWYFDEEKGLWKEEGSATKQGNNYVGTVTHFSFWNCDAPFPVVDFEAVLKGTDNNPLEHAKVIISMSSNKLLISASGFSDSEGKVFGMIPANQSLSIEVFNTCGDVVYSKQIGPFSSKADLGTITVNSGTTSTLVSGSVTNCTNEAVTNGVVDIEYNGRHQRAAIVNGTFTATLVSCITGTFEASVTAIDLQANQQSDPVTLTVTTGTPATVEVSVCDNPIDQFINYTINGEDFSLIYPVDSLTYFTRDTLDYVNGLIRSSGKDMLNMRFKKVTGTSPVTLNFIQINLRDSIFFTQVRSQVNITEYDNTGNGIYVSGNYTGTLRFTDSLKQVTYPVNLSFRLKKQ